MEPVGPAIPFIPCRRELTGNGRRPTGAARDPGRRLTPSSRGGTPHVDPPDWSRGGRPLTGQGKNIRGPTMAVEGAESRLPRPPPFEPGNEFRFGPSSPYGGSPPTSRSNPSPAFLPARS